MTEVNLGTSMPAYDDVLGVLAREQPKAQITDVRVMLTYSEVGPKRDGDAEGSDVKVRQSHRLEGDQAIAVRTEIQTTIRLQPDESSANADPVVARFGFALGITYTFVGSPSEDARVYFGKIQGVHQTWPYYRAHLHSTCGLMGFSPAPIAPLLPQVEAARLAGFSVATSGAAGPHAANP